MLEFAQLAVPETMKSHMEWRSLSHRLKSSVGLIAKYAG